MRRVKIYLAVLGFTLAAAGEAMDMRPLVWAALSVLAMALGLRLWERHGQRPRTDPPPD